METYINGGKVGAMYINGKEVKALYKNGVKGYQKVAKEYYLISNGAQYISTGIKPQASTVLDIKLRGVTCTYYSSAFGTSGVDNNQRFSVLSSIDGTGQRFDYGSQWGMPYLTTAPFLAPEPYTLRKSNETNELITSGGRYPLSTNNAATFDQAKTTPIYLCSGFEGGKASTPAKMELYSCWITQSGVKVFDGIAVPAGKPIDGKIAPSNCLYDKVSKTFFQNAGTGSFGIGERLL